MTRPPIDYEIDETPPVRRAGALSRAALVIAAIVGFAAGYASGDVPHVPAEAFTNCYQEGC